MDDANGRSLTFRSLVTILFRPRPTFRQILDSGAPRIVVPLIALTIVAGFLQDVDRDGFVRAIDTGAISVRALIALNVVGLAIMTAIGVLLFYLFAWLVAVVGRFYGGRGDVSDVRAALAWGAVPFVWSLLYRFPAAFLKLGGDPSLRVTGDGSFVFDPGLIAAGCGTALLLAIANLTVFLWAVAITSATLGEAHDFSNWQGLGTLVTVAIVPVVVAAAALLAAFV